MWISRSCGAMGPRLHCASCRGATAKVRLSEELSMCSPPWTTSSPEASAALPRIKLLSPWPNCAIHQRVTFPTKPYPKLSRRIPTSSRPISVHCFNLRIPTEPRFKKTVPIFATVRFQKRPSSSKIAEPRRHPIGRADFVQKIRGACRPRQAVLRKDFALILHGECAAKHSCSSRTQATGRAFQS